MVNDFEMLRDLRHAYIIRRFVVVVVYIGI